MAYSYNLYTGNGSTTQFPVAFGYIRREHVAVTVAGSPVTFTWVNNSTIQMDATPANGATVRVYRTTPIDAPLTDFADGTTLVASDLDTNAKQSVYIQQELSDSIIEGSAGAIPNGDRGDIVTSVGGTVWTIDNGAVTSAKIADDAIVNADVNASAGIVATKLAFTQSGTGATARTVDSKLKDVVSVKDFGATGDGTTNDTAAFVAALAASDSVFVPIGSYVISSTVTIAARKSLIGAGNKVIILSSVAAGSAAFRLGTAGTAELQYYSALGSLTIQPTVAGNVGVLLYQTCGASVQDIWINSENNLNTTGFKIDGGNMSSFFNILKNCYALHCSVGYDILSTGSSYATQQVFIDCSSFGDYPTVATSIGMRFTGPNGLDSSVYAGNFESCGTGIKVTSGTGLNFNGVRFEANGTDVDLNATTANCTFISCKNISTASGIPGSGDGYGGNVFIGNSGAAGLTNHLETTRLYAASASAIPLKIEAYASQTANLTSWTNNAGVEIAQIRPTGGFWTSEKIAIGGTAYPANFTWDANASLQIKGGGGYNSISFGYPSTADYMAITYNGTSLVAKNQAGTGVYLANGGTSWVSLSDRNQKTFISSIDNGLSKVMTLKAIIYRYLNDGITVRRPGLFAQDVQAVLPEAVVKSEDGTLGLSYAEVIPLLVAAIQDLKQELALLQNKP